MKPRFKIFWSDRGAHIVPSNKAASDWMSNEVQNRISELGEYWYLH